MKKIIILIFLFFIFFLLSWYSDLTNPYSSHSFVKNFFEADISKNGEITLKEISPIYFVNTPFVYLISDVQRFFRIFGNAQFPERPIKGNEEQIINQINKERFDTTKPYVISGGHFAEFYVRNFGVFYNSMLDPRTALSDQDWTRRQELALQTVATHLELLRQSGREYTTYIPVSPNHFIGINIFAEPSDSLFSLLWTIKSLSDENFLSTVFPANIPARKLQTKNSTLKLIAQYKQTLAKELGRYLNFVIDKNTGLVKKDILLSSARDGIKRQSSFYDNVIAWSTVKLATNLGIVSHDDKYFEDWKKKIIEKLWDDRSGIFIDDLSDSSKQNHIFSGDEFIVISTGFLNFDNKDDKEKILRMIGYVRRNNLDKPFPLHYAVQDEPDKLHFWVRYFATSYMGESIWSHWGMEYIKTLVLTSKDNPQNLIDAKKFLADYKNNIEKYGGYPELYSKNGDIFQTPFYKSVLHTGWVINYEEAKMMLEGNKLKTE